ncbi:MAG: prepilin-type N-terminal cleavage/methylation domain-containing protein [Planctomycetota bacterium]|nr:prepilin-type N-terminal cleavage/methylation domain-containing protein [Planctomycetota bacterium]
MRTKSGQPGLTLPEMMVVVTIIALLTALGLPAVRALLNSFETQSGTESLVSAALANARAIAAKEQHYAGIRFQQDSTGNQYMIFILHDFEKTGLNPGFKAIEGIKPIKLPDNSRVMDLRVRTHRSTNWADAADPLDEPLGAGHLDDTNPLNLGPSQENVYITDTSSFSIVFSPAGKLVVRNVRLRNRDGIFRPDNSIPAQLSTDDVLNSPTNIANFGVGKFIQDDYAELGLGAEPSRNRFVICDMTQFDELNALGRLEYLNRLELIHINPYTGTIISPD